MTLYFDTVDSAGHSYGPGDARTTQAVAEVDRHIGALTQALAALGQPANLVIVADHGMAATSTSVIAAVLRLSAAAALTAIGWLPFRGGHTSPHQGVKVMSET